MSKISTNLVFILVISGLLSFFNIVATRLNLFWTTAWADVIAHTLGGVMLGGIVALLISILRSGSKLKYFLWFSLCIGIAWEVFEIHYAITSFDDPGYWPDTFGDIFFDMFGSYVAYLFFKKSLNE